MRTSFKISAILVLISAQYAIATLSVDDCGVTKGCYRLPEGCNGLDCDRLYKWVDDGDVTHIEMNGKIPEIPLSKIWLGFCLSYDDSMGLDDAIICKYNDGSDNNPNLPQVATIEHYRTLGKVRPIYMDSTDHQVGLSNIQVSLENNVLTCKVTRVKKMDSNSNYYDIAASNYYILSAHGALGFINSVPNNIVKHNPSAKLKSSQAFNFTLYKQRHVCQI